MSESKGRRIKRSLNIDLRSVRFCDQDMLNRFSEVKYIQQYIDGKKEALKQHNNEQHISADDLINSRRLTNLGTYRAYLENYLRKHKQINQEMTLMVRQLKPSEVGIPLEIYCFSANQEWIAYEGIMADIFDHAIAMLPVFGLSAYQRDNVAQVKL